MIAKFRHRKNGIDAREEVAIGNANGLPELETFCPAGISNRTI